MKFDAPERKVSLLKTKAFKFELDIFKKSLLKIDQNGQ